MDKISQDDICVIQARRDEMTQSTVSEPFRRNSTSQRFYNSVELFYIYIGCRKAASSGVKTLLTTNHFLVYIRHKIWIVDQQSIKQYRNQTEIDLSDYVIDKVGMIDLKLMFEGPMTYNLGYCIHHVKQDDMFILNTAKKEKNNWVQKRRDAV